MIPTSPPLPIEASLRGKARPLSMRKREDIRELIALKLPVPLICARLGVTRGQVYWQLPRGEGYQWQGRNSLVMRNARLDRIRANIEAYPGKSICFPEAAP